MIYFIYSTIYWIINISYAKSHLNLTKQRYKNTPLKKGALSRNNYLKLLHLRQCVDVVIGLCIV